MLDINLKNYKLVIFDMDGVLVDSEPLYFQVEKAVMENLGIKLTQKEQENFVGISPKVMWNEILQRYQIDISLDDVLHIYYSNLKLALEKSTLAPMQNVELFIKKLLKYQIDFCLATSSSSTVSREILEQIGLKSYFKTIITSDDVINSKPAPDLFLKTLQKFRIKPAEAVIIEDSYNGVLASVLAGVDCIGYCNDYKNNQDLSQANYLVHNFKDLIESIEER